MLSCARIPAQKPVPVYGYQVVNRYPHSTENYTEGFLFLDGLFYEGTGLNSHSLLLAEAPSPGRPVQQHATGFDYDGFTFRPVRQFTYTGVGGGMTHEKTAIITSDGTSTLRFRDPESFKETRHITVHDGAKPISQLNELEYVKGEIYSNVWHDDRIARISPRDGRVLGWIDLRGILPDNQRLNAESVLNGIAYDAEHDRLFVTGKQWPAIFEIKVVSK